MLKFKRMLSLTICTALVTSGGLYIPNKGLPAKAATVNAVIVDPSLQYQTIEGWGTSLAWWGDLVGKWSTSARDELMDLAFDPVKGLGLNIVRYNIGGGENPEHSHMRPGGDIEGYEPSPGVWNWNADAGQRWVLQQAKQRIPSTDFIAEAFSNSPPYWMTYSQCASGEANGGNNLKDDQYAAFADYFTEVIKHFKENWGITFQTADPLNEPIAGWWKANGSQEGCHFDQAKQAQIINEVYKSLVSKGLTDTKISASDESTIDWTIETLNSFNAETKSYISQINTHEYGGSKRTELRDLAASLNKPLYMDEICTGYGSHGHDNMDSGLALADYIFQDMRDMKVPGWEIWQVVDDEDQDVRGNSNWGLIHAHWSGDDVEKYYITKQYYAMAHFSKFIKPGYKIIDANNSNVVAAYDSASKKVVLVARNTSANSSNFSFDLSKFNIISADIKAYRTTTAESLAEVSGSTLSNGYLTDTLPSKSMVTYVISNVDYTGAVGTTANDSVKGTGNNQFDYGNSITWNYYNGQTGAYSNDVHYTNTKDDYYKVSFTGNQVKVYGAKASDSGIAAISINDGAETLVDMYSASRMDNALLYTSPILPNGTHTIKVRVTGDKNASSSNFFLTADRVVSYAGATGDETLNNPALTSLNPSDGRLTVVFSPVDGAFSYNIKYGESSGNYTTVINNVTDNIYNLTGLENGKKYYVVVSAVNDSGETANSNELSEAPLPSDNPNLLYYINAGDSSPLSTENDEETGTRNSSEDQSYGRDPVTGYYWGYIADDGKTWSQDNEANVGSNYGCLRQYDGYGKDKGLEYKFEVPNGSYFITMGFYDPWNSSRRRENVVINGTTVETNFVPGGQKVFKAYKSDVTDGKLSVKVVCSDDSTDHPIISWISVENYYPVTSLSLDKNTLSVERGTTAVLSASISPKEAPDKRIVWTSSNENAATVKDGVITPIHEGNTVIKATSVDNPSVSAECSVDILPIQATVPVTGINLENQMVMNMGDTVKLNGTVSPEDASIKTLVWSSSDTSIVKVSSDGTLTALAKGTAVIKATSFQNESKSAECVVNVVPNTNLFYYVNAGDTDGIEVNEELGFRNSREDQAYGIDPVTGFKWGYIADDNSTWSQDKEDESGNDYFNCLRQYNSSTAGKGLTYSFEIPNGQYDVTIGFYDPWNSSTRKEDIVINGVTVTTSFIPYNQKTTKSYSKIDVTNGKLDVRVQNAAGSRDNPFLSWIKVENANPYADWVTLDKSTMKLQEGKAAALSAVVWPKESVDKEITWTSSDESIAVVDLNGLVTGVKFGTAVITAATVDGNKTAQCNVTVLPILKNITVKADKTLLKGGSTAALTVEGIMTDELKADLSKATIEYSSDNEKAATVSDTGIVTAVGDGTANIKVIVTLEGISREASIALTVDVTAPAFSLSAGEKILGETDSFEDCLPLIFKAWDEQSGLVSAKIKIDDKEYVIDTKTQTSIDIDLAGKLGSFKAAVTAVDLAGNELNKTFSFTVVTSTNSIEELLERYTDSKELAGPMVNQLTNNLAQAQHQLDINRPDQASKHMADFIKHLNTEALDSIITANVKNIFNKDAEYMIKLWSK
jgi:uncharacterized protein YjdB/O-glycosyl hydrolase